MPSPNLQSEISRSYNSFSGSDIRAMIGPFPFAEIQAVSYSVTREKAPVYTMGSPDPRSFSRNKRGIAGSLIWINFDHHALLAMINRANGKFVANRDDVRPEYSDFKDDFVGQSAVFQSSLNRSTGIPVSATIDSVAAGNFPVETTSGFKETATPWYSDQILPFDVTMAGTNEIGAACAMKIFGVEIMNEGYGISIDDAVSEMQATFVARAVEPWQAVRTNFPQFGPAGAAI